MCSGNPAGTRDYDDYIPQALATEGGHLSIGRGGFTLHFARGARLSGYDCEPVKAACIAAGLAVIDSRMVEFAIVARLAIGGPMVAVGEPPTPAPWHAFSSVPLALVAGSYRAAGAEVFNLDRFATPVERERGRGGRGLCDGLGGRERGSRPARHGELTWKPPIPRSS